jgi:hypothetical protein
MQWLQNTNQSNEENLNNVRNKQKEYLETKIYEIATNSKIKNIKV